MKTYSISTKISAYLDYRKFFAAVVEELRTQGVFSHRKFNKDCGFTSPNYLQLVIQGKRNLTKEAARRVSQVLGLPREEMISLLKLIELNHETDSEKRVQLLESLLQDSTYLNTHQLSQDQLQFYSRWYNIPIREMLLLEPLLTVAEIASLLNPKISIEEVEQALSVMLRLELLRQEGARWLVLHPKISTGNEILSEALKGFHAAMLELAKESLNRFTGQQREISALTFRLSEEQFVELRERIREFKKEILGKEQNTSSGQIFQFNFQLFPVTHPIRKGTT